MPTRRLELAVQPPQLFVRAVHIRAKRAELVAVRYVEATGEVARSDLCESRLGALDRPNQRPRQDQAEAERERDADRPDPDEEVARRRIRASVRGDQGRRPLVRSACQLVGDLEEVLVGGDRSCEGRPGLGAGDPRLVERRDRCQLPRDRLVIASDLLEQALVVRRRHEPERHFARRRNELGQREADRPIDQEPAFSSERGLRARQRGGARLTAGAIAEQLAEKSCLGLQRVVRDRPALERSEPLNAGVRLAEEPQPDDTDDDQERGDTQERDQQLRAHLGGHPCNRSHQPVVRVRRAPPACEGPAAARAPWAASSDSPVTCATSPPMADASTISHLPWIFCRS